MVIIVIKVTILAYQRNLQVSGELLVQEADKAKQRAARKQRAGVSFWATDSRAQQCRMSSLADLENFESRRPQFGQL